MTVWLHDLADAARSTGLQVIEVPGWRTRSAAPRGGQYGGPGLDARPRGLMIHHTATPETYQPGVDYPTYNVILNGNGSTGGPLSQLGLCRCGRHLYVFAAGICWHAGVVRDYSWQGNRYCIGIEAEHSGLAKDMPWPAQRYAGYVQAAHGISRWYGIPNSRIVGHKEASLQRKIDPLFSMDAFRRDVANHRGGTAAPAAPEWPTGWIADAQTMLNALGYTDRDGKPLAVDDSLGPATEHATRTYQTDRGLTPVDGRPGADTTTALEADMTTLDEIHREVTTVTLSAADYRDITGQEVDGPQTVTQDYVDRLTMRRVYNTLRHARSIETTLAAQGKVLEQLAAGQGIDPAAVRAAVDSAVRGSLDDLTADVRDALLTEGVADTVAARVVATLATRLTDQES